MQEERRTLPHSYGAFAHRSLSTRSSALVKLVIATATIAIFIVACTLLTTQYPVVLGDWHCRMYVPEDSDPGFRSSGILNRLHGLSAQCISIQYL